MQQLSGSRTQAVVAFFRSAVFYAFFFGDRRVRFFAWGGLILLGSIAALNAGVAYYLASLQRIVGDMQKHGASSQDVWALVWPFIAVYVVLAYIEPKSELLKTFIAAYWAKIIKTWFSDRWIMDYRRIAHAPPPEGVSQIIVDRPMKLTVGLVQLFVPSCRALIILVIFGYLTFMLSYDLTPEVARYVPGWLLVPGWLFYLSVFLGLVEARCSYLFGRTMPDILDTSYRRLARFRRHTERNEKLLRESAAVPLCERIQRRDEARERIDAWFSEYLRTFKPSVKLLLLKNGSQQTWQFISIAMLPLMAVSDMLSLGTVMAVVYAISEMRGALLTLPNQWLMVVDLQAQALGLMELEAAVTATGKPQTVPSALLAPAE